MSNEKPISLYIIEDYLLTRKTYTYYLSKSSDLKILGDFESAEACLAKMKVQPSDVVIVDLGLPGMNGLEAIKRITDNHPSTKIIVLTSHETEEEIFACMASGAKAYVLKDIDLGTLKDVVKLVYSGAVWIDPRIVKVALSVFPQPISTDFNNLYIKENQDINLTEREREVLRLVVLGKSNTEIAKEMFISPHTAKSHVCKILEKLGVGDRTQAAVKAVRYNIFK